jgi:putative serine protease PepD
MHNDTPDEVPEDSHDPFISERNAAAGTSVPMDMTNEHDTPRSDVPPSTDHPAEYGSSVSTDDPASTTIDTPAADAPDTVGDRPFEGDGPMEAEPPRFDYDAYYGVDPGWVAEPPVRSAAPIEAPAQTEPPRRSDTALFFVGALAAGVLGAALTVGVLAATGTLSADTGSPGPTTATTAQNANIETTTPQTITNTVIESDLGSAVNPTAVAVKAFPSIVTVTTYNEDASGLTPVGSGSGVVISSDGYLATNDHVVDGATVYHVIFEDGREYVATLVGTDPLTDLAVIKIDADNLVPIEFGSVDDLALGDPAVAVGNPLGQKGGSSISVGIISAFDRQVEFGDGSTLFGMIQTDAAINSGSSGGALLDKDGRLIGITSAIGVSNAGPEGIGYAIPEDLVKRITDEIIETGDVQHPFLGVTIADHEDELADGAVAPDGAEIITIEGTDSAAGAAGLQVGDIIVAIGDEPISTQNDLILAVRLYRVGDSVTFTALRDGESMDFTVVMGQRPAEFGG